MSIQTMNPEQDALMMDEASNFWAAAPYVTGTLAVSGSGIYVMATMTGTAALVSGIALTLIGAYATFGVIGAAVNSKNPIHFSQNVMKGIGTGVVVGLADTARMIAQVVIQRLVIDWMSNR
ncbi:hypothetical protein COB11_03900 [Candidatus Aerophobetes bacterium]|uniref:Uncharacterized protein n=1 Tax=Aerophobetes bacterium TaxID=2030807 RepID=A0A2A4YHU0_UNCAE|nr:MAG: hypothetical protein COB11_03900 [Candidatus Aerophobetes bacterium]